MTMKIFVIFVLIYVLIVMMLIIVLIVNKAFLLTHMGNVNIVAMAVQVVMAIGVMNAIMVIT